MAEKKLFLVDGMPLVYRAYFVFINNPLLTQSGFNSSAIFGFTNTILQIIEEEKPTHLAVVFDTNVPTHRHREYPAYKAQREKLPEDIAASLPHVRRMTTALGIPIITYDGAEADDVIGTLAHRAATEGFRTFMVTPDKDFGQLVTASTSLYRISRLGDPATILGPAEVTESWGVERVEQVVDAIGLAGDSVDNIPGVPGIGAKTASKLLAQFGSVEEVVAHTDQLKGKQRERLAEFAEQALLSKRLARIRTDVPLEVSLDTLAVSPFDAEKLVPICDEFEFASIKERLFGSDYAPAPRTALADVDHDYRLVEDGDARRQLVAELRAGDAVVIDLETDDVDPKQAGIVGIALCIAPQRAFYLPVPEGKAAAAAVLADLEPLFGDAGIAKVGHNIKFDLTVLAWHGLSVAGEIRDTMLAHTLTDPEGRNSLGYLAERELDYAPIPITALIGEKGKEQGSIRDVAAQTVAEYSCEDADITLQLWPIIHGRLETDGLTRIYDEIEAPLVNVLVDMEREGVRVDVHALAEYANELEKDIADLEQSIYRAAGREFNLNSPKQLGELLFDELQIDDKPKKTKTGQYMTNEQTLARLDERHPIVRDILDYRVVQKLKGTYVDTLPDFVHPETGRIHTTFNQLVATTGRMNSENPNLQNIPIRTDKGREIRRAFVARDDDHLLLSADYSQIELRIVASLSGDEEMIADFSKATDIHAATAAKVFGVAEEAVTADMRRKAKMVNFGIIYGISAFGLAQRLNIARSEASMIIERYLEQYAGIEAYMEGTKAFAHEHERVETVMGRRRPLREINSRNRTARAAAERVAINAPIQGTAADMIKLAMIRIHAELQRRGLDTKMVLQIHDELVFDMPRAEEAEVRPLVTELMAAALPMRVPILVESGVGSDWMSAH